VNAQLTTQQLTVSKPELEKRLMRLRKIAERWKECGETECAAIYHGAASEIEILLKDKSHPQKGGLSAHQSARGPLKALEGQPLCKYYTGASLEDLRGDYSCKCLVAVPYERWCSDMERWPCRRRHIIGLEQHTCEKADYGTALSDDVDAQVTKMAKDAIA
jgi:hypothetical protein